MIPKPTTQLRRAVALLLVAGSGLSHATLQEGLDALTLRQYGVARARFEAEGESAEALFQLGALAAGGLGEARNETRAAELYRRAGELGHARARLRYIFALGDGRGVAKDAAQALSLLVQAGEGGNHEAMGLAGVAMRYGWWGLPADKASGVRWLLRAAEAGDALGRFHLALAYQAGDGVERDPAEVLRLLRLGTEQQHVESMLEFAQLLLSGSGVGKNEAEGVALIRRVADSGNRQGQRQLGMLFLNGQGLPKDEREAARWIDAAARQGDGYAQGLMGDLFRLGRGVPQNKLEAFKWYTIGMQGESGRNAERYGNLRNTLATDMSGASAEEGLRRAREFVPQPGFKPLPTPLADLPRGNTFVLGGKDIKVPLPSGYVNTAELSDVVRRTYPNDAALASTLYTLGFKQDLENSRLGLASGVRQIHLQRAYASNDIDIQDETFARIREVLKNEAEKAIASGAISNVKTVSDDANSYVVSRTINRNPQFVQAYGMVRVKSRVFEYHMTGFRQEQEAELHRTARDFAGGLISGNTGFFGQ